jgi:hypothetical protein
MLQVYTIRIGTILTTVYLFFFPTLLSPTDSRFWPYYLFTYPSYLAVRLVYHVFVNSLVLSPYYLYLHVGMADAQYCYIDGGFLRFPCCVCIHADKTLH